ncbi:MAG: bifunctional folylpolyglutamate synthase/dihydrofolate synthase [Acetatifactor sp.]|nr:bifunctional folylpolyglutamate synthase/dihydrofolate synthase [Acetatifactor sp.]
MQKRSIASFEEAENYINTIPRFTSKNTMEDTKAFLRRLGSPDRQMRIIHVAGTNGKGSVCAYMRSILEAAGYRVALFTSPHLVDIRERFVVDGEMISKEDFLRGFLRVYDMLDWEEQPEQARPESTGFYHPSYFEYLFFMAMVIFPEREPDFCILETGLGGRLDATNSVSKKELAVITHIGLDHVEYLGDTVEKIAWEKSCIMQEGAPAVYWDTDKPVSGVFEKMAAELGVTAYPVSKKDYRFLGFRNKSIDFSVHTEYYSYISLTLHTIAAYQMENAALAVRAVEVLDGDRTVSELQIRQGIERCFWAGRMEEVLPEVYVDGAHNEDGIRAFLETVAGDGHTGSRALLFSAVKDKDCGRMVEELVQSGLFDRVFVAHMRTGRGVSVETFRELFERYPGCGYRMYDNVSTAFHELLHSRRQDERVYIAGSLYLAGEIKELLRDDKF